MTKQNSIQSTLVISNSKGLCEIFRDIRTSTYQICRIEESITRPTVFNKCICNLTPEVRYILKNCGKKAEIAPPELFLLFFHNISLPVVRVSCLTGQGLTPEPSFAHLLANITKTRLYNIDPLKPHLYIVTLAFTGVYIIFRISAQNIDCGYSLEPLRRGGSNEYPNLFF